MKIKRFNWSLAVLVLLIVLALPAANVGANIGYSSKEYQANGINERGTQASTVSFAYLPVIARNHCGAAFYDDFSSPGSGWPYYEDGDAIYNYLNGEYQIVAKNDWWWVGARPGYQAADYNVKVDVRKVGAGYGSYGILFGLAGDWSHFYSFDIDPDGYYSLWYRDSSGWKMLADGNSPHINKNNAVNRIGVKREGSKIEVFTNDHLLITTSDDTYTGLGYAGLVVYSYEEPNIEARFDNFSVVPLSCEAATMATSVENQSSTDNNANPGMFMNSNSGGSMRDGR
jgi:hypothetical protein